jgi:nucleotide-binding universal stress UspA family protein
MNIRKICVPMSGRYDTRDPENLDGPALQAALIYAKAFRAEVEVLCVTETVAPELSPWTAWIPNYGVDELFKEIGRLGNMRRDHARKTFDQIMGQDSDHAPCSFVENAGDVGDTVGDAGRLSDLIVLASSKTRWGMPFRPIMDASLRRTGRPVLVSPQVPLTTPATNITIAWNNSVESARALATALPLLTRNGAETTVITCQEDDNPTDLRCDELVAYLQIHDVNAKVRLLQSDKRKAAQTILSAALDQGSDLLVLGTVIHSRAHSFIYGSLTEAALSAPKLPALLVP